MHGNEFEEVKEGFFTFLSVAALVILALLLGYRFLEWILQ